MFADEPIIIETHIKPIIAEGIAPKSNVTITPVPKLSASPKILIPSVAKFTMNPSKLGKYLIFCTRKESIINVRNQPQ